MENSSRRGRHRWVVERTRSGLNGRGLYFKPQHLHADKTHDHADLR
ncbi:hypothetical protein [Streptomyces sp. NRRL WC-3744]|nr:hypothetical protein [Streptomyces sp. NRRL WC-3744]